MKKKTEFLQKPDSGEKQPTLDTLKRYVVGVFCWGVFGTFSEGGA